MKKAIWLTGIILAVGLPLLSAGSAAKHPIDAWLTSCMEKDPSTQGMNACLGQAYEKWDLELNRVYRELSGKLDPEAQAVLREPGSHSGTGNWPGWPNSTAGWMARCTATCWPPTGWIWSNGASWSWLLTWTS
jgi:hypothetical protein